MDIVEITGSIFSFIGWYGTTGEEGLSSSVACLLATRYPTTNMFYADLYPRGATLWNQSLRWVPSEGVWRRLVIIFLVLLFFIFKSDASLKPYNETTETTQVVELRIVASTPATSFNADNPLLHSLWMVCSEATWKANKLSFFYIYIYTHRHAKIRCQIESLYYIWRQIYQ